jgi:hypothetical protein
MTSWHLCFGTSSLSLSTGPQVVSGDAPAVERQHLMKISCPASSMHTCSGVCDASSAWTQPACPMVVVGSDYTASGAWDTIIASRHHSTVRSNTGSPPWPCWARVRNTQVTHAGAASTEHLVCVSTSGRRSSRGCDRGERVLSYGIPRQSRRATPRPPPCGWPRTLLAAGESRPQKNCGRLGCHGSWR